MKAACRIALIACALLVSAQSGRAQVIGFDDLGLGPNVPIIANGYHGFDWTNFSAINATDYGILGTGYDYGRTSGVAAGWSYYGMLAEISAANPFTFNGGNFTAAWDIGATLSINGYLGASLVYSASLGINNLAPTAATYAWTGIDRVTILSNGGQIVYDDLRFNNAVVDGGTVTPEPVSMTLLGTGLAGIAIARRRNRKSA